MCKTDNLPTSCAVVTKSGSLNFLEPPGPVQTCNGTTLPLPLYLLVYQVWWLNEEWSLTIQKYSLSSAGKVKGKDHPRTGHEDPEGEYRNSSTLSLNTVLDGMGGQRHSVAISPRKRPGIHCVGGRVGPTADPDRCGISHPSPGFDLRTVQAVASRYIV